MDGYTGVILALGFQFAPRYWGYCSGTLVSISQQNALFSLLGVQFGGNGTSVFGLPDLRGRAAMGQFQGPGLTPWTMGEQPGTEYTSLTGANLPTHTHLHTYRRSTGGGGINASGVTIDVAKTRGTVQLPSDGDFIAAPSDGFGTSLEGNLYVTPAEAAAAGTASIGGVSGGGAAGGFDNSAFEILDSGAGTPVNLMQPSLVVNFCICMQGIYPSRS